jgi:Cdc6-like AAA superfamily ATPase
MKDFSPHNPETSAQYYSLELILKAAYERAAFGKGKQRHASHGQLFEEQQICELVRIHGHGFTRGQVEKKLHEAARLPRAQAMKELLDCINYLAADIIVLTEEQDAARRLQEARLSKEPKK